MHKPRRSIKKSNKSRDPDHKKNTAHCMTKNIDHIYLKINFLLMKNIRDDI